MKPLQSIFLLCGVLILNSCASGYKPIQPTSLNYISNSSSNGVTLEYKYDLLKKKYQKKESKNAVKLISVKIKNNTEKDLVFGKDIKLTYDNGDDLYIMENQNVYESLKQSPASYLWYLLLTPVKFYTTETSSSGYTNQTSSTPIGFFIGPGLAGGNMITASSANKKFKTELIENNINGRIIKKGETSFGLIGIRSNHYSAIKLVVE
jgi:hypothetical protein